MSADTFEICTNLDVLGEDCFHHFLASNSLVAQHCHDAGANQLQRRRGRSTAHKRPTRSCWLFTENALKPQKKPYYSTSAEGSLHGPLCPSPCRSTAQYTLNPRCACNYKGPDVEQTSASPAASSRFLENKSSSQKDPYFLALFQICAETRNCRILRDARLLPKCLPNRRLQHLLHLGAQKTRR